MSDHTPTHDVAGHHASADASGHHNDPESIRKEVRTYLAVLFALGVLTIVTVWVSKFHLTGYKPIVLALFIASIKASLVALIFMHLKAERRFIYGVLILTTFFFGMLLWIPHVMTFILGR